MSLRRVALFVSVSSSVCFGIALSVAVHAQEVPVAPPLILKMADGRFYHPASGTIANSEQAILDRLAGKPEQPVEVVAPPVEPAKPVILQAVYRAQEGLRTQIAAEGKNIRYKMKPIGQDAPREVTLAVWNKLTDQVEYVKAVKTGKELNLDGQSPVQIKVRLANWINTDYTTNDPNHQIVAVRYPIFHEVKSGKKVVSYSVEEAVYTPYTGTLATPEVILEGEKVLDDLIAKATDDLNARNVKSRALSGKTVTQTISKDLVKALVVIEHSNSSSLRQNPGVAVGQVYATIALNPGQAYNYAKSSAGALGLMQFIPSTYNRLAKRTELGLNGEFESGMRDHENALKASYGYLDAVLGELPASVKDLPADSPKLYEYLAAAYNGGSSRVKTAVKIWDEQISGELKPKEILKRSRLQPETIDYVKKMRAVMPVITGKAAPRPGVTL